VKSPGQAEHRPSGVAVMYVIATKTGLEWREGKVYRNATRARIMQEVDDSLRRLRTDYIDIYQVHWPDPLVSVEETAEAMRTLYEQGKIRAIGVSNFSVAQMERFRRVTPLHVLQPPYNLFERSIEAQILPYCRAACRCRLQACCMIDFCGSSPRAATSLIGLPSVVWRPRTPATIKPP
jgi:aryl-alcohol dehydrogenase-like predicted oxidoreductase